MSAGYTPLRQHRERSATAAEIDEQISEIFINPQAMNSSAPIVKSELDDSDTDDRPMVSRPYPGVDDGFFDKGAPPELEKIDPHKATVPGIEVTKPETSDIPNMMPRLGPDGDNGTDNSNGAGGGAPKGGDAPRNPNNTNFLRPVGFDMETASFPGDIESSIPDVNVYQHKKTLAQGMMDLALFSANANQLRYVLESFNRHPYYYPSVSLIGISLLLQIAVGIGLIWNATYNVKDKVEICIANKISNFTIIGIFLVTVINVFISAFGVADPN